MAKSKTIAALIAIIVIIPADWDPNDPNPLDPNIPVSKISPTPIPTIEATPTPKEISKLPKTIYVDDDFEDEPVNHRWNTIQEGINDAEDGDTIIVHGGIYYENFIVGAP
jgi:hypothetical protein